MGVLLHVLSIHKALIVDTSERPLALTVTLTTLSASRFGGDDREMASGRRPHPNGFEPSVGDEIRWELWAVVGVLVEEGLGRADQREEEGI